MRDGSLMSGERERDREWGRQVRKEREGERERDREGDIDLGYSI
jgi:hypothetical protein